MKSEILKKLCDNRRYVAIERDNLDSGNIRGFILALSNNLVLLQNVVDFHLDGYSIIRRRDITHVWHNEFERYYKKILKKEGLLDKVGLQETISLNNWPSVFHSLKRIGKNIIIEKEFPDVYKFLIGKIIRINKKHVNIRYFDANGKWERGFRYAPYEEITRVQFENEYIKVFSKYLHPLK